MDEEARAKLKDAIKKAPHFAAMHEVIKEQLKPTQTLELWFDGSDTQPIQFTIVDSNAQTGERDLKAEAVRDIVEQCFFEDMQLFLRWETVPSRIYSLYVQSVCVGA